MRERRLSILVLGRIVIRSRMWRVRGGSLRGRVGGGGLGVLRFRGLAEMLWLAAERTLNQGVVMCVARESFYQMRERSGQTCLGDPVAL